MEAEYQDDNNTHLLAGISVSCQAFPATSSKRIQARVSPPTQNQGVCNIRCTCTCIMYVCVQFTKVHLCFYAGVNVSLTASTVDVGVQCNLIPLVMTSTPKHSDESEDDEINLLPDQMGDNLSASWGEVTEEIREDSEDDDIV